jgi:hypothetical protein
VSELTVLCWLWHQPAGRAQYTGAHVNIWADMVRRNLSLPHRLMCVTDTPAGIDPSITIISAPTDFAGVRVPSWPEARPQCLRRLAMFSPGAGKMFGARFVCMDLDCVIAGPLDPLFDRGDDLVICQGTSSRRPYNGSMLMMTAGARPQVFEKFTPQGAAEASRHFVGSDQAWISHILGPSEKTWGPDDGVRWWSKLDRVSVPTARAVFFPGQPKPWDLVENGVSEWVETHYRRSDSGRCLVLGYGETVWADASAALDGGPFDAVIASPEAAEHWPGPFLAVAKDDEQAERLARMHGFADFVFCGRSEAAEELECASSG